MTTGEEFARLRAEVGRLARELAEAREVIAALEKRIRELEHESTDELPPFVKPSRPRKSSDLGQRESPTTSRESSGRWRGVHWCPARWLMRHSCQVSLNSYPTEARRAKAAPLKQPRKKRASHHKRARRRESATRVVEHAYDRCS